MKYMLKPYIIDCSMKTVTLDGQTIRISRNEFALLCILLGNSGKDMWRDDIHKKMWGTRKSNSIRTVDNLIRKLRKTMPLLRVQTIYGKGYRLLYHFPEENTPKESTPAENGN